MADIKPSFVTGAKAVVKIRNVAVAFCNEVNYNVNVEHVPIEALGIFEIISHEPVAYTVSGSFSVVRYASDSANQLQAYRDALGAAAGGTTANTASGIGINSHINPSEMLSSTTFDMQIIEKGTTAGSSFFSLTDCRITSRSSSLNKRGVLIDNYQFVAVRAADGAASNTGPSLSPEQVKAIAEIVNEITTGQDTSSIYP
jgi:hypothetical protein